MDGLKERPIIGIRNFFKFLSSDRFAFDPLGRTTVPAGSDHCFRICFRPYVRIHFSKYRKTNVALK